MMRRQSKAKTYKGEACEIGLGFYYDIGMFIIERGN